MIFCYRFMGIINVIDFIKFGVYFKLQIFIFYKWEFKIDQKYLEVVVLKIKCRFNV